MTPRRITPSSARQQESPDGMSNTGPMSDDGTAADQQAPAQSPTNTPSAETPTTTPLADLSTTTASTVTSNALTVARVGSADHDRMLAELAEEESIIKKRRRDLMLTLEATPSSSSSGSRPFSSPGSSSRTTSETQVLMEAITKTVAILRAATRTEHSPPL